MKDIVVSISRQELAFFDAGKLKKVYSVSTAKKGAGECENSFQTPRGRHIIRAKIGASMDAGAVFVGRRTTGEIYSDALGERYPNRDWILSRILWLSGIESGKNRSKNADGTIVDSMRRYIYIHGAPDTEPMGTPASHGCIRMRNKDVIELFEQVPYYCPITIY